MKTIKYVGVFIGIALVLLAYFFLPVTSVKGGDIKFYSTMHDYCKTPVIQVTDFCFTRCGKPNLAIFATVLLCIGLLIALFANKFAFFASLTAYISSFIIFCVYLKTFGISYKGNENGYTTSFSYLYWIFIVLVIISIFTAFICFYKSKPKKQK